MRPLFLIILWVSKNSPNRTNNRPKNQVSFTINTQKFGFGTLPFSFQRQNNAILAFYRRQKAFIKNVMCPLGKLTYEAIPPAKSF